MNIEGLMIIYENRPKDEIFEKLFECLSREERNQIWEEVTGFEYEGGFLSTKKSFDKGIKEGLKRLDEKK